MALQKTITDNKGISTTYHRVSHVSLNNNDLSCTLQSYVSEIYRENENYANAQPYFFVITVEEEESMGIRALCYTKLKELEEWADATDC